ncbi:hypothetical protein ABIE56_002343 [Luteibacter sp. 621]|uniref:hypothetical protein n=1 Tax=Luteibacter TaxID=242605 RepID=UPI001FF868B0|nr:hypothetical protein [Luteibacter aegosomatissinici]UPG96584.1 hypothetical protein L2Y97_10840 [Luteibacter aegosomatissinici]
MPLIDDYFWGGMGMVNLLEEERIEVERLRHGHLIAIHNRPSLGSELLVSKLKPVNAMFVRYLPGPFQTKLVLQASRTLSHYASGYFAVYVVVLKCHPRP